MGSWIETVGNLSAIITAVVALLAYVSYRCHRWQKRQKLERYLQQEKTGAKNDDKGQRTLLHLMARLGMTEQDILQASFDSQQIARKLASDKDTGHSTAILFEWTGQ